MNPRAVRPAAMNSRLDALFAEIKTLEREIVRETQKQEAGFCYEVHGHKVRFTEAAKARDKQFRLSLHRYLLNSRLLVVLTTPIIWLCLVPIALADLVGSFYQAVCFPIYGIPKVNRSAYLALDRHRLSYLNFIEKLNCDYCAYANGILAYFTEIAARTEQHWCPIKHARCIKCAHDRYKLFFDFGDAQKYREHVEEIRRSFQDVAAPEAGPKPL
jgi:hypothetical protein